MALPELDGHTLWTMILSVLQIAAGWLIALVREGVKDLERADEKLSERVGEVELLVAGNYVKKDEFERKVDAFFDKLDRIAELVHQKADRNGG